MILQVDDLTRPDHTFLQPDDECYYLGEYTARQAFSYSETNSTIHNLKKSVLKRGLPEYRHKVRTIAQCGVRLRDSIDDEWIHKATIVPVPPSKPVSHPAYDDRILRIARAMQRNNEVLDIRRLVLQRAAMRASHECAAGERPRPEDLAANYYIDEAEAAPEPTEIAVIDDLLTTGSHFRAMKAVLLQRFPGVQIAGFFVARRQVGSDDLIKF